MDNFNKVLSFILGLVVVIVFFAVLTGRLSVKRDFPFISTKATPTTKVATTPTPTPISSVVVSSTRTSTSTSTSRTTSASSYNRYQTTTKTPSSIPSTGSPTVLLPFFISILVSGLYLRRKA